MSSVFTVLPYSWLGHFKEIKKQPSTCLDKKQICKNEFKISVTKTLIF